MGIRTLKQIEASRINGAKSRGPIKKIETLAAGNSAERSAVRYQFLAGTVLLTGESLVRFVEMAQTFVADLRPSNALEAVLIDKMVMAHWCQLRAAGLRKSTIELEMTRHQGPAPNRAAEALKDPAESIASLRREEIDQERQFYRNLRALLQLKERRGIPNPALTLEAFPSGGTWEPEPPESEVEEEPE